MNLDRSRGCLLGLAVGDALGGPLEFKVRGEFEPITDMISGGAHRLNIGEWTDDTSMALCLADSILATRTIDPDDLMPRFIRWWDHGENSHNGRCFDIGGTTRFALWNYKRTKVFTPAANLPDQSGNGAIMRLAPIPICWNRDRELCAAKALEQCQTTHGSDDATETCVVMALHLFDLLNGRQVDDVVNPDYRQLGMEGIGSSGYCVSTLQAALWCISNTSNFRDAVLKAVNLGDDSDTIGAVTGQYAGAIYGRSGIPQEWLNKLVWHDKIDYHAIKLAELFP